MDFGLVFQQAIDRQDRTQVEGRFNYWNHWRYTLHRTLSHNRTRTHRTSMTCLVGNPSIEGYYYDSCNRNDETISQTHTSQETDSFASRTPLTPTSVNTLS